VKLIGRVAEQRELRRYRDSGRPELVAVYGRRRVGKTFLVRQFFADQLAFSATGTVGGNRAFQLKAFDSALTHHGWDHAASADWFAAFGALRGFLESRPGDQRLVVFLDEFPWFDTPRSDFRPAFGHFWNDYAATDPRLLLIVCGSATAWIAQHLLQDRGALHNRVTGRLRLAPFTLGECEEFFRDRGVVLNRYQQLESFMIFGGIPYYLDLFDASLGLTQNVDRLCFSPGAPLATEYDDLYRSLIRRPDQHLKMVEALAGKTAGLTRDELIDRAGLAGGGHVSTALAELGQCGFVAKSQDFARSANGAYYRLVDPFTLFHRRFLGRATDEHFWTNALDDGRRRAWTGLAFEQVCLAHVPQIKRRLGVAGVVTTATAWRSRAASPGAQIDLVLDRRDGVINLCELKYTAHPYALTRAERDALERRRSVFAAETGTRKALHTTMVTTYGLVPNAQAAGVTAEVTMDDLFEPA